MVEAVYALCLLTSATAAFLLLRGYRRSGARLLLWCGLGFIGLALNNLMLVVDFVVLPNVNLGLYRAMAGFIGPALLVFGMIWDSERPHGGLDG